MRNPTVSASVPIEIYEKIVAMAKKNDISISCILAEIIESYFCKEIKSKIGGVRRRQKAL